MRTDGIEAGMSACFFHADPNRAVFPGKTFLTAARAAQHP